MSKNYFLDLRGMMEASQNEKLLRIIIFKKDLIFYSCYVRKFQGWVRSTCILSLLPGWTDASLGPGAMAVSPRSRGARAQPLPAAAAVPMPIGRSTRGSLSVIPTHLGRAWGSGTQLRLASLSFPAPPPLEARHGQEPPAPH